MISVGHSCRTLKHADEGQTTLRNVRR